MVERAGNGTLVNGGLPPPPGGPKTPSPDEALAKARENLAKCRAAEARHREKYRDIVKKFEDEGKALRKTTRTAEAEILRCGQNAPRRTPEQEREESRLAKQAIDRRDLSRELFTARESLASAQAVGDPQLIKQAEEILAGIENRYNAIGDE